MKKFTIYLIIFLAIFSLTIAKQTTASIGTIDSANRYAYGENIGWLDFGTAIGNVQIHDGELTGYIWGENIGWLSLNCLNDNSCATVDYKISNNGSGVLSGYSWSENTGWINFNPSTYGVSINASGEFMGYAYGENIGWLSFNCSNDNSCSTVDYKVKTDWRPASIEIINPVCNNKIDDDADGKIDYPSDPGCSSLDDTDETDVVIEESHNHGGGGSGGGGSVPPPSTNVKPPLPNTIITQIEGCALGNLFSSTSGKLCIVGVIPTLPGVLVIPGCDNRTTGFSMTTGKSCIGNSLTANPISTTTKFYNLGTTVLRSGSNNEGVKELQRFLNSKGYTVSLFGSGSIGFETNYFGLKTKQALIKFQNYVGLKPDGIVGTITKNIININK